MKNVFLVYDNCCFYEIVILNYFMKFTGEEVVLSSLNGEGITCIEGYSVNVNGGINDINIDEVKSLIIPGGEISKVNVKEVHNLINAVARKEALISGICSGVDILDEAGVLKGIESTHSRDVDIIRSGNIITSRANGYVDFAIEVAKALELFKSDEDLQETIDFWKYHRRAQ